MKKLKGIILCIATCMATVICAANFKPNAVSADTDTAASSNVMDLLDDTFKALPDKIDRCVSLFGSEQERTELSCVLDGISESSSKIFKKWETERSEIGIEGTNKISKCIVLLNEVRYILITRDGIDKTKSLIDSHRSAVGEEYCKDLDELEKRVIKLDKNSIEKAKNALDEIKKIAEKFRLKGEISEIDYKKMVEFPARWSEIEEDLSTIRKNMSSKTLKNAVDLLIQGFKSGKTEMDIIVDRNSPDFSNLSADEARDYIYSNFLNESYNNPDRYTYRYTFIYPRVCQQDRYYFNLSFNAAWWSLMDDKEKNEVDNAIEKITRDLNLTGKSDLEKVRAIYEYLKANCDYHYESVANGKKFKDIFEKARHERDAFKRGENVGGKVHNALIERKAVCSGFALTFRALCQKNGVHAEVIDGKIPKLDEDTHAWNIVKIGNKFYNVDVTNKLFMMLSNKDLGFIRGDGFNSKFFDELFPMSELSLAEEMRLSQEYTPGGTWLIQNKFEEEYEKMDGKLKAAIDNLFDRSFWNEPWVKAYMKGCEPYELFVK